MEGKKKTEEKKMFKGADVLGKKKKKEGVVTSRSSHGAHSRVLVGSYVQKPAARGA